MFMGRAVAAAAGRYFTLYNHHHHQQQFNILQVDLDSFGESKKRTI